MTLMSITTSWTYSNNIIFKTLNCLTTAFQEVMFIFIQQVYYDNWTRLIRHTVAVATIVP